MLLVIQKGSREAGLGKKWGEGMNGPFYVYEERRKRRKRRRDKRRRERVGMG